MKKLIVMLFYIIGIMSIAFASTSYFNDALFIGDSRVVGRQATGVIPNATYFAKDGMSLYNMSYSSLDSVLSNKKFGKVYILLGINDIGYDLTDVTNKYSALIQRVRAKQPNAIIFIEANMHVSKAKSTGIFSNTRINNLNNRLANLANNKDIFYIDVNKKFDDKNGNLNSAYTYDGLHMYLNYYGEWSKWLIEISSNYNKKTQQNTTTDNKTNTTVTDKNTQQNTTTTDKNTTTTNQNTIQNDTSKIEIKFTDVPSGHWAEEDIKRMVSLGIMAGKGNGIYGLNDSITAEEFLVALSKLVSKKNQSIKIYSSKQLYLQDKIEGWSKEAYLDLLRYLANSDKESYTGETEMKLILGNTDAEVLDNYKKEITREKVANLMGRFIDDNVTSNNVYLRAEDWDEVNDIYKERINKLATKNIFRGSKEGDKIYVNAKHTITRAEATALLNRLYDCL